ncbi:MAG: hypothetical protein CL903_00180 [Dehalococcoidia bacterium]|nr:hypothetical protein [Dehalococcoidia bacterium]MQG08850.1 hypothetical protein [SAR202 cluster bacterium]
MEIDFIDLITIFIKWLHSIAAMSWVGGSIFFALIIRPVQSSMNRKYSVVFKNISIIYRDLVDISVIGIILSGIFLMFTKLSENITNEWMIVFIIKLFISVIMFYLVWRFRQKDFSYTSNSKGLYGRLSFLLGYNAIIFFGVIIFLLTSTMSQL